MKQTRRVMLWALAVIPIAGAAAAGILRAQQSVPATGAVGEPGGIVAAPPIVRVGPPSAGAAHNVFGQADGGGAVHFWRQTSSAAQSWPEPDDPEIGKLKQSDAAMGREEEQLAARYAAAEQAEERNAIKAELAEHLTKHFSIQQQIRDRELARVEARVKKLRELTEKRRDAQKTIVEQRLDQLLREAEGLGWTPPASAYGAAVLTPAPRSDGGYNGSVLQSH